MVNLNLEAKWEAQKRIKAYLEQTANEHLADKINNGVQIVKDGKTLINKKDLDGFMSYASGEARKQAEQGATGACVLDEIVYGWAMHYFEEDSIEGKLFNIDGTPYKAVMPKSNPSTQKAIPVSAPKPKEQQVSLFDMIDNEEKVTEQTPIDDVYDNEEEPEEDDYYPDDETIREIMEEDAREEQRKREEESKEQENASAPNSYYGEYVDCSNKYYNDVVVMRLGDFYEAFGGNAIKVADLLDLTLTSKIVGADVRVPMVGFPFHVAELYISKINARYGVVRMETDGSIKHIPKRTSYVDNYGEIRTAQQDSDDIWDTLQGLFGDQIIDMR